MAKNFDLVIAGLGAMGSAVAWQASERGLSVAGFDRWTPPHRYGSTHGRSRIIRRAYHENEQYVPLAVRAWELWEKLERSTGRDLLLKTGALYVGPPGGEVVGGALHSAKAHKLPHRELSPDDIRRSYPQFAVNDDEAGVWEEFAGVLNPEKCVESCLELASSRGAGLHYGVNVRSWKADGGGVTVVTDDGEISAGSLVIAAGPWICSLVPELRLPVTHKRMVQFWFRPKRDNHLFAPGTCPVYIFESMSGELFYGFPDLGGGVKAALHTGGAATTPETFRAPATEDEISALREAASEHIPALRDAELVDSDPCIYTMSPDEDFLIDRHPEHEQVVVLSPCSGHGFKFSSAIGQAAVQLAIDGRSELDLGPFAIGRLLGKG